MGLTNSPWYAYSSGATRKFNKIKHSSVHARLIAPLYQPVVRCYISHARPEVAKFLLAFHLFGFARCISIPVFLTRTSLDALCFTLCNTCWILVVLTVVYRCRSAVAAANYGVYHGESFNLLHSICVMFSQFHPASLRCPRVSQNARSQISHAEALVMISSANVVSLIVIEHAWVKLRSEKEEGTSVPSACKRALRVAGKSRAVYVNSLGTCKSYVWDSLGERV